MRVFYRVKTLDAPGELVEADMGYTWTVFIETYEGQVIRIHESGRAEGLQISSVDGRIWATSLTDKVMLFSVGEDKEENSGSQDERKASS